MKKENECAATYYVNGYTRADGTEVAGYYRTCGAMHNSDTESGDNKDNTDNIVNGDFSLPYRLYGKVEENHTADEIDTYKQDLIDEVKNTEVEVKGMGKIKAGDLIPNIEKYIEDTRTKMEKRADRIYSSMKNNNKYYHDIKLIATAFPYFVERMNQELEAKGKQKVENIEVMESFEWDLFTKDIHEAMKQWKIFTDNTEELKAAMSPYKFLNNLQGDEKRLEDLKEMIDDYVNGGIISEVLLHLLVYKMQEDY